MWALRIFEDECMKTFRNAGDVNRLKQDKDFENLGHMTKSLLLDILWINETMELMFYLVINVFINIINKIAFFVHFYSIQFFSINVGSESWRSLV